MKFEFKFLYSQEETGGVGVEHRDAMTEEGSGVEDSRLVMKEEKILEDHLMEMVKAKRM
jgi:hypothetical protein